MFFKLHHFDDCILSSPSQGYFTLHSHILLRLSVQVSVKILPLCSTIRVPHNLFDCDVHIVIPIDDADSFNCLVSLLVNGVKEEPLINEEKLNKYRTDFLYLGWLIENDGLVISHDRLGTASYLGFRSSEYFHKMKSFEQTISLHSAADCNYPGVRRLGPTALLAEEPGKLKENSDQSMLQSNFSNSPSSSSVNTCHQRVLFSESSGRKTKEKDLIGSGCDKDDDSDQEVDLYSNEELQSLNIIRHKLLEYDGQNLSEYDDPKSNKDSELLSESMTTNSSLNSLRSTMTNCISEDSSDEDDAAFREKDKPVMWAKRLGQTRTQDQASVSTSTFQTRKASQSPEQILQNPLEINQSHYETHSCLSDILRKRLVGSTELSEDERLDFNSSPLMLQSRPSELEFKESLSDEAKEYGRRKGIGQSLAFAAHLRKPPQPVGLADEQNPLLTGYLTNAEKSIQEWPIDQPIPDYPNEMEASRIIVGMKKGFFYMLKVITLKKLFTTAPNYGRQKKSRKHSICIFCGFGMFKDRNNLHYHIQRFHTGYKVSCPLCGNVLTSDLRYMRHIQEVHRKSSQEMVEKKDSRLVPFNFYIDDRALKVGRELHTRGLVKTNIEEIKDQLQPNSSVYSRTMYICHVCKQSSDRGGGYIDKAGKFFCRNHNPFTSQSNSSIPIINLSDDLEEASSSKVESRKKLSDSRIISSSPSSSQSSLNQPEFDRDKSEAKRPRPGHVSEAKNESPSVGSRNLRPLKPIGIENERNPLLAGFESPQEVDLIPWPPKDPIPTIIDKVCASRILVGIKRGLLYPLTYQAINAIFTEAPLFLNSKARYIYVCIFCGTIEAKHIGFCNHIQMYHTSYRVSCSVCEAVFCTDKNYEKHLKKFHPSVKTVDDSQKVFMNKATFIVTDEALKVGRQLFRSGLIDIERVGKTSRKNHYPISFLHLVDA